MSRLWIIAILLMVTLFTISCVGPQLLTAEDYNKQGLSLAEQGKYYDAIKAYTKAIELDPKKADYYVNRGDAYHNTNQYELAIADYKKALELDPNNTVARGKLQIVEAYRYFILTMRKFSETEQEEVVPDFPWGTSNLTGNGNDVDSDREKWRERYCNGSQDFTKLKNCVCEYRR